MAALRCFLAIKINLEHWILFGQYTSADRFLRNSGYLVEREVLSTFGCQFLSKRTFENLKIPKFAKILLKNGSVEMLFLQ